MLSLERSGLVQTVVVSLVTIAALALLGVVLAHWTWEWLAPRAEPRAQPVVAPGVGAGSAQGLFGILQRDRSSVTPTGSAIRLLGIVAATPGRRSYAVVQLEAKEIRVVRAGEEIAPGIVLEEVQPDRVLLVRNGARESLAWPQKNGAAESAAPRINK